MKLHSMNFGGNIHATVKYIDDNGLVPYLFSLHSIGGSGAIAVFRFEDEDTFKFLKNNGLL